MRSSPCLSGRVLMALALTCGGCAADPPLLRSQATRDLKCPEDQVSISRIRWASLFRQRTTTWLAEGCGKKETYLCDEYDNTDQESVCRLE
jgi:hypothetical protein